MIVTGRPSAAARRPGSGRARCRPRRASVTLRSRLRSLQAGAREHAAAPRCSVLAAHVGHVDLRRLPWRRSASPSSPLRSSSPPVGSVPITVPGVARRLSSRRDGDLEAGVLQLRGRLVLGQARRPRAPPPPRAPCETTHGDGAGRGRRCVLRRRPRVDHPARLDGLGELRARPSTLKPACLISLQRRSRACRRRRRGRRPAPGPLDTKIVTVEPSSTRSPGSGRWRVTVPSGTSALTQLLELDLEALVVEPRGGDRRRLADHLRARSPCPGAGAGRRRCRSPPGRSTTSSAMQPEAPAAAPRGSSSSVQPAPGRRR